MTFSKTTSRSTFSQYFQQFHKALDDEIRQMRKAGGQRTYLSQGIFLNKRSSGKFIYAFVADAELRFPDDTPIELALPNPACGKKNKAPKNISGTLTSTDGFDIILALDDQLPQDKISSASLITSPIFLLEELKKRLHASNSYSAEKYYLGNLLLNPDASVEIDNTGDASTLLQRLEDRSYRPVQRNEGQEKAVNHVLKHRTGFVWGPPGTGKTTTLGMTVASLTLAGESVLVLSHSNMAVDTAMKSVAQHLKDMPSYEEGQVIRFGIPTPSILKDYKMLRAKNIVKRQHPELIALMKELRSKRKSLNRIIIATTTTPYHRKQLDEEVEEIKKQLAPLTEKLRHYENQLVRVAQVVGCTLSKAIISPEIFQRQFDAVIVDEASMVSIPHCVFASTLAKRRIAIFGDFRQLAPIAQSNMPEACRWLKRDIFDQAGITEKVNNNKSDSRLAQLNIQYRMHPSISAIPNELCYGNSLEDGMNVAEQTEKIASKKPYPGHALVLCDLSYISASCSKEKESHSRFNLISALLAANLAYQSAKSGADDSVGIISPYKAQSRLLHKILQDVDCAGYVKASTVHRFQGSEQNVIIFDAVDSAPQDKVGLLLNGGMSNSTAMRLSNVAISRSKGKFIGVWPRLV